MMSAWEFQMDLFTERSWRILAWALFALALAYAFATGLRTVADFDVGWILAMGRQLVSQHQIPRSEFLSYTAYGVPWIYPSFGGALLYLAYAAGGFAALSWVNALACAAVVALAVGRPRILTAALAVFAVPSIVLRTAPRAELFTTLFFAAFLALLRRHRQEEKSWLWLLPLIMIVWVNAHPGFVAGIAVLGVYVALELLEFPHRAEAVARLKSAWPWLGLTVLATVVNPWGVRVYQGLVAQQRVTRLQSVQVGEWSGVHLSPAAFASAFQLRDPNSSFWCLLIFACFAALVALYRRQFASALLLAGAAFLSVQHLRFQASFAIVVVVLSGEVFERPLLPWSERRRRALALVVAVMVASLALLRVADTVSDRSYLANGEITLFGAGLSWWYPQRAAEFIERNALPAQLFNDYNSGGYLTVRLGPRYRDFADGRAIPFPAEVLALQPDLVRSPPDSLLWRQEADGRAINTIILSLARFGGLEAVPLKEYCESAEWKPVYLDEVSIVLVRNIPQNQPWIARREIDCAHHALVPPPADRSTASGRAELYNFYANAASIYYVLGRDNDAYDAIAHAANLFGDDPNLPQLAGQLLEANGRFVEAEAQFRRALRMRPTDNGWYLLARLFIAQKNYPEAALAVQHSADLAVMPAERYRLLGNVNLAMNQPADALAAFDRAEHYGQKMAPLPSYPSFRAKIAEGRGRAWLALRDPSRATGYAEEATRLAPEPQRWNLLADCYAAQGRIDEAAQARSHAGVAGAAAGGDTGTPHPK
jgi:tetratricopeptide (TPR) repeat protein